MEPNLPLPRLSVMLRRVTACASKCAGQVPSRLADPPACHSLNCPPFWNTLPFPSAHARLVHASCPRIAFLFSFFPLLFHARSSDLGVSESTQASLCCIGFGVRQRPGKEHFAAATQSAR